VGYAGPKPSGPPFAPSDAPLARRAVRARGAIGVLLSTASFRTTSPRPAPAEGAGGDRATRAARLALLAVGALTIAAFGLRLVGIDQGLFGDELFLYAIATRPGLRTMLNAVHDSESTPPFHFFLAWMAAKIGDPTITVRLPSLVLGSAAVPVTYALGLRALSRPAALIGAALLALSPFAIFYSDEARAYATLTFLAAFSTLALLMALQTRRRAWWALYALSGCLILYTHYTGAFVVFAQAAWAAFTHRDRLRELAVATGAIVLAYLPWLPSFRFQSHDTSANRIASFKTLTPADTVRELTISLSGHPNEPLRAQPGRAAVALLGAGVAVALVGALVEVVRARRRGVQARAPRPAAGPGSRSTLALIAILALATPVGLLLYSISKDVYIPRNLTASLPALCLLIGAGLAALRPWLRSAATAAVLAGLLIGTVKMLEPRHERPPYRAAAHYVDVHAGPHDAVVEYPLFAAYAGAPDPLQTGSFVDVAPMLGRHLAVELHRPHDLIQVQDHERGPWQQAASRGGRLLVVLPWDARHRATAPLPPTLDRGFRLVHREVWQGLVPVAVLVYAPTGALRSAPRTAR
jgi:4-amino-4-deoxy-L-arabinose transferase-like glycosyltransferase